MGVKLVFVMEGEAPKLKAETMSKRTETRYGRFKKASAPKSSSNTGRGRFKAVLREVRSTVFHLSWLSCVSSSLNHYFQAPLLWSCPLSVQICWTFWACRGWLLLGRLRPCVPIWTHRALWTAASPMMEMHFCMGPELSTGTSTWTVKYVSGRWARLQRTQSRTQSRTLLEADPRTVDGVCAPLTRPLQRKLLCGFLLIDDCILNLVDLYLFQLSPEQYNNTWAHVRTVFSQNCVSVQFFSWFPEEMLYFVPIWTRINIAMMSYRGLVVFLHCFSLIFQILNLLM